MGSGEVCELNEKIKLKGALGTTIGMTLDLNCDLILLVPPDHWLASRVNQTIKIQVDKFLEPGSGVVMIDPNELNEMISREDGKDLVVSAPEDD